MLCLINSYHSAFFDRGQNAVITCGVVVTCDEVNSPVSSWSIAGNVRHVIHTDKKNTDCSYNAKKHNVLAKGCTEQWAMTNPLTFATVSWVLGFGVERNTSWLVRNIRMRWLVVITLYLWLLICLFYDYFVSFRFIWIMGVSITLSFRSLRRRKTNKFKIAYKIIKRSLVLFGLGLFTSNCE